jgi:hypothetical protein
MFWPIGARQSVGSAEGKRKYCHTTSYCSTDVVVKTYTRDSGLSKWNYGAHRFPYLIFLKIKNKEIN